MRILITGAAGFLGRKLAARLIQQRRLTSADGREQSITELTLFDIIEPPQPTIDDKEIEIEIVKGDITDRSNLQRLVRKGTASVFHLAAVVSSAAEEDFALGMEVNFDGTRALLDACRNLSVPPRLVFTSSVAVFGGVTPELIEDTTAPTPKSSYGTQKAMGELLVNDYARRGFVDGRAVRLPTIVVRPGRPNRAASSFASSIIREPLQGHSAVCPVPAETALFVLSPRRAVEALIHAHELEAQRLGTNRTITLGGLTVTVAQMLDALGRVGGAAAVDRVSWEDDPQVRAIVDTWPSRFATVRADALGFYADDSIDNIVAAFIEDELK
jgi:nucleoside-diphosphate-sugar epimerase